MRLFSIGSRTPRSQHALGGGGGSTDPAASDPAADAETVLFLIDVAPQARAWGLQRYVLGARSLKGIEGLRLVKVLGSGHEGGFGLRPSGSRQGLLCVFDSREAADRFVHDSALAAEYRANAREFFSVRLRAYACRGTWSGVSVPVVEPAPPPDSPLPLAALTRASIRPGSASAFWKMAPAAQEGLQRAFGCRLAVGLGEAPLLRQATFTLWDSAASMDRYARAGAHQAAIVAAHQQQFFSESMFVRFVPRQIEGRWKGRDYPQALTPVEGEAPLFASTEGGHAAQA